MAYVVPAVLGGLAIAVMALVSSYASRKRNKSLRHPSEVSTARVLIHSINDDRCTGCDACVAVCPTNVLDLVENKSRVLHFQDCIQCEACMWACPTTALVMHPEGTQPPAYKMPELDEFFQTAVPGQYLIGEVAGKPLVKNAANLGRGVVEHMLSTGLQPSRQNGLVDVAIVGSGPGGLSAALTCVQRGLSYIVLDKENIIASTVARYPKGKLIMAEPYDIPNLSMLPVFDSSKEEMVPIWKELVERVGIKIKLNETIETVTRRSDGVFEVHGNGGNYHAQRVVLATGLRGKPRTLNVTGENQAKVYSLLEDPDEFRGLAVCVVGGGDSALEAAIALADSGAKVVLSYRGRSFARAQQKNKKLAENYADERRIKIKYMSQVVEFGADTVTLEMSDGAKKRYPNQAAFVLIGADPPIKWLNKLGVQYVERPHMFELSASAMLVKRFLGAGARECPPTAELAAKLVRNEEVPIDAMAQPERHMPVAIGDEETMLGSADPGVSAPRRFLRAATQMFRGNSKLEKPMPLSEFAKAQRKHSGRGRRDQLDAGERTRILRMLRDEGGRKADEESKIFFLEDLGKPESQQRSFHEPDDGAMEIESLSGITTERTENGPPPAPSGGVSRSAIPEQPAKPAVIVGLARAAAEGPRVSRHSRTPTPAHQSAADPIPDLFRLPDSKKKPTAPKAKSNMSNQPENFFSASPEEATQFAPSSNFKAFNSFDDPEATQLMDSSIAAQFSIDPNRAASPNAPSASTGAPPPARPRTPGVAKTKKPPTAPPPIPAAAKTRVPPQGRTLLDPQTAVPAARAKAKMQLPPPPKGAPPPAPLIYSNDFEDNERTMLADFDPQELMRQVAEADKVRAGDHSVTPTRAASASAPGPAASLLDPNMLFSSDDIDAATQAIELNRLPTNSGAAHSAGTVDADFPGDVSIPDDHEDHDTFPPPSVGDQTNTRVESLSDVDWDLE